jgi:hypothetical protein
VQYAHCIPIERFALLGLADFVNASGRDAYLARCPPGNTTLANVILKEIGAIISNVSGAPGGFALLGLAVGRSCGDATVPMSAPGSVIVLTVLVTLATLSLASEVAERLAMRKSVTTRRSKSGGPFSINADDIVGRRSRDLGGDRAYEEEEEEDDDDDEPLTDTHAPVSTPNAMENSQRGMGGFVATVNRRTPLGARSISFVCTPTCLANGSRDDSPNLAMHDRDCNRKHVAHPGHCGLTAA